MKSKEKRGDVMDAKATQYSGHRRGNVPVFVPRHSSAKARIMLAGLASMLVFVHFYYHKLIEFDGFSSFSGGSLSSPGSEALIS